MFYNSQHCCVNNEQPFFGIANQIVFGQNLKLPSIVNCATKIKVSEIKTSGTYQSDAL